jgi:hypothetical protein
VDYSHRVMLEKLPRYFREFLTTGRFDREKTLAARDWFGSERLGFAGEATLSTRDSGSKCRTNSWTRVCRPCNKSEGHAKTGTFAGMRSSRLFGARILYGLHAELRCPSWAPN